MRDRLIELIESARYWGSGTSGEIADYLLANGVIVPPCKVGDNVYFIVEGFDEIMQGHIRQFTVAKELFVDCVIRGYFNQVFHSSKFGKTVFLTKEEAEKALGGVKG